MLRKILTVAIFAGVLSGMGISVIQEFTTTPLILEAEKYEKAAAPGTDSAVGFLPAAFVPVSSGETHDEAEGGDWAPVDGLERLLYTGLSNTITGVGFALLLVAGYVIYGGRVDGRLGVIWGAAGFAVVTLGPGLGLPPELPGLMAADLEGRQAWWFGAVFGTALGIWLMVFRTEWVFRILGIGVLVLPHLIGAPYPSEVGGDVPPELAAHFAAASLVTSAVFWAMLGWLSGVFYERFSVDEEQ